MKRVPYVVCLSLLLCFPVLAQNEAPRTEIFGGYSHIIGDAQGWNASLAVNPNGWFGVVSDFSGLTQSEPEGRVRANTYLFGPQFSYRGNRRLTPFVRFLFGATSINARATDQSVSISDTRFSHAAGGGLDIRINKVLSIRAIQADYVHTSFFEEGQSNGRLSFGIVLRFGGN
jgi:opacity protein-like surface antigen